MCKKFKMSEKEYPTRPKWSQKENKRMPNDAKVVPTSSLGAFELFFIYYVEFFVNFVKTIMAHL